MKKLEVCRLLSISLRTLERRMSTGEIKFTRSGQGQYASVDFNPNDLQLAAPEPGETAGDGANLLKSGGSEWGSNRLPNVLTIT
jgi:hypothetical protein